MSTELVTYADDGGIATLTMDDGKANALSMTMLEQLDAALDRAESGARAVVLAGREGRFCAGFDLRVMMSGPDAAIALVKRGGQLLLRIYEYPLPVVMAVTGHALAAGILLAATGDTRIGATGAFKLGLNEVTSGMPVPVLAHELARDRLLASELLPAVAHARIYDPDAAVRAGWLDRAVDPADVLPKAQAEAAALARLPAHAYALSKRSLRRPTLEYIRNTMDSNLAELLPKPA